MLGRAIDFSVTQLGAGSYSVRESRGLGQNADVTGISYLAFQDGMTVRLPPGLEGVGSFHFRTQLAGGALLRDHTDSLIATLAAEVRSGELAATAAIAELVNAADATTSVATLAYQFFTGKIPTAAGLDYLVSPTGPNLNNLTATTSRVSTWRTATSTSRSTWASSGKARRLSQPSTAGSSSRRQRRRPTARSSAPNQPTPKSQPCFLAAVTSTSRAMAAMAWTGSAQRLRWLGGFSQSPRRQTLAFMLEPTPPSSRTWPMARPTTLTSSASTESRNSTTWEAERAHLGHSRDLSSAWPIHDLLVSSARGHGRPTSVARPSVFDLASWGAAALTGARPEVGGQPIQKLAATSTGVSVAVHPGSLHIPCH